jgi:cell division protein FtsQ
VRQNPFQQPTYRPAPQRPPAKRAKTQHVNAPRAITPRTGTPKTGTPRQIPLRTGVSQSDTMPVGGADAPSPRQGTQRAQRTQGTQRTQSAQGTQRTQGTQRPVEAVTVAERRKRVQAAARRNRGISLRVIVIPAVLLLLVLAGVLVYYSSLFAITEVRVEGAKRLTADHLAELAAVPVDSTLLRINTDEITERLQQDPWVKSAVVEREFPATVVLLIVERPIAALVDIPSDTATGPNRLWLISDDAYWLSSVDLEGESVCQNAWVPKSELDTLISIKDVLRTVQPVEGALVTDEGVRNALSILNTFTPEMRSKVESVSAPDEVKTSLSLKNHVGVAFGAAEDIPAKEAAILRLLKEHEGNITYINVRVANRASCRLLEE